MANIIPTEEQSEAIESIESWYKSSEEDHQIFLLDGGAGVGKSTVAGIAVERLGLKNVVYGAYTAKAARIMMSKGMKDASTLHRILYHWDERRKQWDKLAQHSSCQRADLIVVDEVSMVNDTIALDILSYHKPLLVLGDIEGQLPPIEGTGAFTSRRPDYRLHEIHRTALDSPINKLAWAVRQGYNPRPGDQVCSDPSALVQRFLPDAWASLVNRDWQVICGKHKTRLAVTRRCREAFGFEGRTPQPGEPLICCRNDYNRGFVNGDIAVVWRIIEDNMMEDWFIADLILDGGTIEDVKIWRRLFEEHFTGEAKPEFLSNHKRWQAAEFDWAYAITVHKAQGSEFANVIFIDDQFAKWDKDLRRRLLYTAITRASEKLLVLQAG